MPGSSRRKASSCGSAAITVSPLVMQMSSIGTVFSTASEVGVRHLHQRRGLQRGADHLVAALDLQRAVTTRRTARMRPISRQRRVAPAAGRLGDVLQVHRAVVAREAFQPDLLHREDEDRREPRGQPVEQDIQHRPRRAPPQVSPSQYSASLRMSK
jgi:hypothetical protein